MGHSAAEARGGDGLLAGFDRGRVILALLAVSTVVGLVFATHFRVYHRIGWPLALWWGLKSWYLWGAMAPLVVWIASKAPVSRERWLPALAVHLLAAVSLAVLHPTLGISLSALVEGLGDTPFLEAVEGLFLKRYTLNLVTYFAIAAAGHLVVSRHRSVAREERAGTGAAVPDTTGRSGAESAERLLVRRGDDRERFLEVDRIDRIDAEGNYVRIHVGEASCLERRTLKSLEAQLDPSRFLRIHRSHIVNLDRVDRIEAGFKGAYVIVLDDGTRLPLSRTYRKRLEERIGETF
ncbi:MAG: LytTR family DNA-binding domain-containing protein [Gemmatimonadota bacterium]|nr:LytTR family DNA-binding domain-containing protein [Gemmatimonadota bacterium]